MPDVAATKDQRRDKVASIAGQHTADIRGLVFDHLPATRPPPWAMR